MHFNLYFSIMPFRSDLTYKAIAMQGHPTFDANIAVDWAIAMLELGIETPNILILAGIHQPTSYYEVAPYLLPALRELHLPEKNGDSAIISYCIFSAKRIVKRDQIRLHLQELKQNYYRLDQPDFLLDFSLLEWAWQDIESGYETYYFENANADNIESLVVQAAQKWLEEHADSL
ncbi:hypothetical protein WJU16_05075 [Chitinophaga pollutisoli]|uniref:Uncharacterized protein n=1 Tax=Chitinophaga pollutisoli TaxID=3133966 RepID=A0ABZ2YSE8_9BACT